jgi:hypothetical protein
VASAQVAIEHQDVACIVAGQFPVLDACFRPGPDLARARVYFRPEGAPNWYYVEASTPTPPKANDPAELLCRRATLPKPKKSLLEKHVEYYLEATGKRLESSQTETFRPLVVKNEGECKKKVVAPFVPNAAVQVFPAMPAAFAAGGGLSGAAVAAVVGAGVAGGTGVVVAARNGGGPAPTTLAPVTTTQPPITVPATTTTTTLPPEVAFDPVFKVFNNGVLQTGTKIAGTEPLKLRFYMCESTGPLLLKFGVTVNGGLATAGCDTTITFTTGGFTTGLGAVVASRNGVESRGTSYSVVMQIVSDGPGNNPKASAALTVDVSSACGSPTATLTSPLDGTIYEPFPVKGFSVGYPVTFTATASGPSPIQDVSYYAGSTLLGTATVGPYQFDWSEGQATAYIQAVPPTDPACLLTTIGVAGLMCCEAQAAVFAVARDACAAGPHSNQATIKVITRLCSGAASPPVVGPLAVSTGLVSQLDVPGGRAQVVLNGSDAVFPARGRVALAGRPRSGENRVEATLVQATGQPGLWRFELGADQSVTPGSLRVIAGQVGLVTPDALVFRMKGRPGERVVFTFRLR